MTLSSRARKGAFFAAGSAVALAAAAIPAAAATLHDENLIGQAGQCNGGYTNWGTPRDSLTNVTLHDPWDMHGCAYQPATFGFHGNSCSSFTSIGPEVQMAINSGATVMDIGGSQGWNVCWRYSTRQTAGGYGYSYSDTRFALKHKWKV